MIAIFTAFHGPTNHRGARYSARTADGARVFVAEDYERDAAEQHARAAMALVVKLGLAPATIARFGDTPDGRGYVFAIVRREVDGQTFTPAFTWEVA